jgi:hypothetical protein
MGKTYPGIAEIHHPETGGVLRVDTGDRILQDLLARRVVFDAGLNVGRGRVG